MPSLGYQLTTIINSMNVIIMVIYIYIYTIKNEKVMRIVIIK